jgi:hypothetical protein
VVITVVITSKNQIKEKVLKSKTLGYLPKVLFFNAFELGAVVSENAHIGAQKELKINAPQKNLKQ